MFILSATRRPADGQTDATFTLNNCSRLDGCRYRRQRNSRSARRGLQPLPQGSTSAHCSRSPRWSLEEAEVT